jgi:hypothetical protein
MKKRPEYLSGELVPTADELPPELPAGRNGSKPMLTRAEAAAAIKGYYLMAQRPKAQTIEELYERADEYMEWCSRVGAVPTMAGAAAATGYSRSTIIGWARGGTGVGLAKQEFAEKIRYTCEAVSTDLALRGKIAAVPWIFNAKNDHGLKDESSVNVNVSAHRTPTADELRREAELLGAPPPVESEFVENEKEPPAC